MMWNTSWRAVKTWRYIYVWFWALFIISVSWFISCDVQGGLQEVAEQLELERIGPQHQAGSDSLLTGMAFFKMREVVDASDWESIWCVLRHLATLVLETFHTCSLNYIVTHSLTQKTWTCSYSVLCPLLIADVFWRSHWWCQVLWSLVWTGFRLILCPEWHRKCLRGGGQQAAVMTQQESLTMKNLIYRA